MVSDTARTTAGVGPSGETEETPWDDLRETKAMKDDGLIHLRALIAEEVSLKCPTNDEFLTKFLRAQKYDVGKALKNIRKYFKARRDYPEIFEDRVSFPVLFNVLCREHQVVTVSRKRDMKGRGAAMFRMGAWNTSICSLDDFFRMSLIQAEHLLLNEENQLRGVVIIMDFNGLCIHHLNYYTPSCIKKFVNLIQDSYPVQIKGLYATNNPAIFDVLFAIGKPFMNSKLVRRCRLFGYDLSKLHGVIPEDLIPESDGGSFESFNYDQLEKDQQAAAAFFNDMNRYGYSAAHQETT